MLLEWILIFLNPEDPDLIINNNGSKEDLLNYSKQIIEVLKKK